MSDKRNQSFAGAFAVLQPFAAFAGEVMLAGADWSHQNGHSGKFLFGGETDLDSNPMAEFTLRRGKKAGTRFHMILIEIQDDETPVNVTKRDKVEAATQTKPTGKTAKRRSAAMLCKSPEFHKWLIELGYVKESHSEEFATSIAKEYILRCVGISSRKELDNDSALWEKYQITVLKPYNEYLRKTNQ